MKSTGALKLVVDPMTERVHLGGLARSGDDQSRAAPRDQIGRGGFGEVLGLGRPSRLRQ